jgi:hypothetical protein
MKRIIEGSQDFATRRCTAHSLREILIVISAAVTSFLGKPVRIRSAKMLRPPYEIVNPWSQQQRVFVQAAHAARPWSRPAEPRRRIGPGVRH